MKPEQITKEEALAKTEMGMLLSLSQLVSDAGELTSLLDGIGERSNRMAMLQYAGEVKTLGDYLAATLEFYELAIDKSEDFVFYKIDEQVGFAHKDIWEEMLANGKKAEGYTV
jgi:hypothetical protein